MCWLFHKWKKWENTGKKFEKFNGFTGNKTGEGVEQRRDCEKCGILKKRIEWVHP